MTRMGQKISNRMKDLNHKLSRKIVNKFDLIAFEKLNPSEMVKKVDKKEFVNPHNTSKRCFDCGKVNKKLKDEEVFVCLNCDNVDDRDVNAAKNIFSDYGFAVKLRNRKVSKFSSVFALISELGWGDRRPRSKDIFAVVGGFADRFENSFYTYTHDYTYSSLSDLIRKSLTAHREGKLSLTKPRPNDSPKKTIELSQKKKNLSQEQELLSKEYHNLTTIITAQARRQEIEVRQKEIAAELLEIQRQMAKETSFVNLSADLSTNLISQSLVKEQVVKRSRSKKIFLEISEELLAKCRSFVNLKNLTGEYLKTSDLVRQSLQAYREGMVLDGDRPKPPRRMNSFLFSAELYGFYQTLPNRHRCEILEKSLFTYLNQLIAAQQNQPLTFKSGTGKSTIAALLTEYLNYKGYRVQLIDTDPLQTSQAWVNNCQQEGRLVSQTQAPEYQIIDTAGCSGPAYGAKQLQQLIKVYHKGQILQPLSNRVAVYGLVLNGNATNFFQQKDRTKIGESQLVINQILTVLKKRQPK
ncbi:13315_t:CDS:2 [Entrophospora sp. SA101]|nr:13315_t:CDS:2 [Entrophospora sp. SA101]